jgi:WD40 repeat protein
MNYPDSDEIPALWEVGDLILDLYDVTEIFTGGGMGMVYRVHHRDWHEDLAVKSPRPEFFSNPSHQENFVRECVSWIGLGLHPHIVACYYVRLLGGIRRVFAEYIAGGSLKDLIETRSLYEGGAEMALERILDIAIQMAWGLHYAHGKGLVHQDVKPANVMLTPEGVVKVTDFGLAKARAISGEASVTDGQQSILVSSGGMTPAFCSLEQVNKQPLTRKTDIWSWGLSVLEMFAGEVFWHSGAAATEALNFHLENGAEEAAIPKMPVVLAELLRECFQQTPEQRPRDLCLIVERLKEIHISTLGLNYGREEGRVTEATADVLNNEGISYHDLGLTTEAEQCFERALVVDPHHLEATYNRGLVLWRSARITDDNVIQQLQEAGKSHPSASRTNYLLGLVHLERSDTESALRSLTAVSVEVEQSTEVSGATAAARAGLGKYCRCFRTFEGHSSGMDSVAISPDGRLGLSGNGDRTLSLWDLASGKCLRTFYLDWPLLQLGGISSVTISPDGRLGLSGGADAKLRLWDLASGQCLRTLENVGSNEISPDWRWVLLGGSQLRLWDLSSGECLRSFEGHSDKVSSVAISPDGRWGLSGSDDKTLRLWDLTSGECLRSFEGHTQGVSSVSFSPDGRRGLSGSDDKTLRLWDLTSGKCLRSFEGHSQGVSSVVFSPDGRWGLSSCSHGTLRLWDLSSGGCLRSFEEQSSGMYLVKISPDARRVLLHGTKLRLWDLASGQCLRTLEGGLCAVSPDWRWVLLGGSQFRLWDLTLLGIRSSMVTVRPQQSHALSRQRDQFIKGVEGAEAHLMRGEIDSALLRLSDARSVYGYERDAKAMSLLAGLAFRCKRIAFRGGWHLRTFEGHSFWVDSVKISPDGRWGLSGSYDKTLRLWDLTSGECLRSFEGHTGTLSSVAFSPDGRWGLSGSRDGTLRLWDLVSGQCLRTLKGHSDTVSSVAFSPDGRWGFSASSDHSRRLWDLASGQCLRTFEGRCGVNFVEISPDGRWGLAGTDIWNLSETDYTMLRLWDLTSGECLRSFEGHTSKLSSAAISPDGRWGLSGSYDKTLRLWDLTSGQCLRTFEGHSDGVSSVAFSPDARWGLSGSGDKTLRLWDLTSGQCLRTFEGHSDSISSVAFSPDGRWALSGGHDNTLRLWELDWEYEFPGLVDWDEGARFTLANFLTLHTPFVAELPTDRTLTDDEITRALTRSGTPCWNDGDFKQLLRTLACAGYGWLNPDGVRMELISMAKTWSGKSERLAEGG